MSASIGKTEVKVIQVPAGFQVNVRALIDRRMFIGIGVAPTVEQAFEIALARVRSSHEDSITRREELLRREFPDSDL